MWQSVDAIYSTMPSPRHDLAEWFNFTLSDSLKWDKLIRWASTKLFEAGFGSDVASKHISGPGYAGGSVDGVCGVVGPVGDMLIGDEIEPVSLKCHCG